MDIVWDKLALVHYQQLVEGMDVTFHKIFLPMIIDILQKTNNINTYHILDAGCGTGYLTGIIARYAPDVIGLDNSAVSIEIAKQHNKDNDNVKFEIGSLENYSKTHLNEFNFIVAHLVLHVVENLNMNIQSISYCLKKGGVLLITIPHPCFWAIANDVGTWKFLKSNSYEYNLNSTQQNIITIRDEQFITPHYHRPLEFYITSLVETGLIIKKILEPIPDDDLMLQHNKKQWPYPRFLFLICQKE